MCAGACARSSQIHKQTAFVELFREFSYLVFHAGASSKLPARKVDNIGLVGPQCRAKCKRIDWNLLRLAAESDEIAVVHRGPRLVVLSPRCWQSV